MIFKKWRLHDFLREDLKEKGFVIALILPRLSQEAQSLLKQFNQVFRLSKQMTILSKLILN